MDRSTGVQPLGHPQPETSPQQIRNRKPAATNRRQPQQHARRPGSTCTTKRSGFVAQHQRQLLAPRNREATPYQIVKAQELLSRAMPFMSQETELVHQAHGLLQTWATALWGQPIILVNDSQTDQDANPEATPAGAPRAPPGGGDPNYPKPWASELQGRSPKMRCRRLPP